MRSRQLLSELFMHVNVYVVYWVVYSRVYMYVQCAPLGRCTRSVALTAQKHVTTKMKKYESAI